MFSTYASYRSKGWNKLLAELKQGGYGCEKVVNGQTELKGYLSIRGGTDLSPNRQSNYLREGSRVLVEFISEICGELATRRPRPGPRNGKAKKDSYSSTARGVRACILT